MKARRLRIVSTLLSIASAGMLSAQPLSQTDSEASIARTSTELPVAFSASATTPFPEWSQAVPPVSPPMPAERPEIPKKSKLDQTDPDTPGVRFSVGGGYAYRLGKEMPNTSSFYQDLNKQLSHGYNLGGELHYVFASGLGLGVNAQFTQSSIEYNSSDTEHQNIVYVGPSLLWRADARKVAFVGAIGFGGLFFTDRFSSQKLTGHTFGTYASLGCEFKLSPTTAFGLKISTHVGNISQLKSGTKEVDFQDKLSASNLMVTAFISFRSHKK